MAEPLVSVIIPVYNGARFLGEALASVRAQDYRPLEVIVVDDGSTDESAAIAAASGARLIRQANAGVAAARNAGVAAARGAFLAFLDQDDLWSLAKLRLQIGRHLAEPRVGHSLTWGRYALEPGMARPPWLPEALLVPHPSFAPSALVIGAETFARVGPFDTTLRAGSDSDWLFRAKDEGEPLAMLPETLVIRRIHRYNHSHETGLLRAEMLRLVRTSIARQRAGPGDTGHGGDGATI